MSPEEPNIPVDVIPTGPNGDDSGGIPRGAIDRQPLERTAKPGERPPQVGSLAGEPATSSAPRATTSRATLLMHVAFLLLSCCVIAAARSLTIREQGVGQRTPVATPSTSPDRSDTRRNRKSDRPEGQTVVVPIFNVPLPVTCTFRRITGVPCPGCGLTRSFISLAHGQWRAAWRYNPAGWLYFAIVLFQLPYRTFQLIRLWLGWQPFRFQRMGDWVLWTLAVALMLQWAVGLMVRALAPIADY